MIKASHKVALGVAVLLFSGTMWILTNRDSSTLIQGVSIEWEQFPVVSELSVASLSQPKGRVVLIFAPNDCNRYRAQINAWHAVAQENELTEMIGVITVPFELASKRYTQNYGLPFPVVVDTTAWFEHRFNLRKKPVIVLLSRTQTARMIYLNQKVPPREEIRQHLAALL